MALINKGLFLPTCRIEAEEVKPAHRKKCVCCGDIPLNVRLAVTVGSSRSTELRVYCRKCAFEFLTRRAGELERIKGWFCMGGWGRNLVRWYPFTALDPSYKDPEKAKKAKEKKKRISA